MPTAVDLLAVVRRLRTMTTAREAGAPDWLVEWLGPDGNDIDPVLLQQLLQVREQTRGRGDDTSESLEPEFTAAAHILRGNLTLEHAATTWREALAATRRAKADLDGAIIASSVLGIPEKEIAARAGFGANRVTVRRALGKPT